MRTISDDERRARLAQRHGPAPSARPAGADVTTIAGALGGLHATDPATVFLAARARLTDSSVAAIERALSTVQPARARKSLRRRGDEFVHGPRS